METFADTLDTIRRELASDDAVVRAEFLSHFTPQAEEFANHMANAVRNWRTLDAEVEGDENRAYVSAWAYAAISLHIASMKLFLSGQMVASGNLFRQVVETIAIALLCSTKELNVLERFKADKYSSKNAVRDMLRNSDRIGLIKDALASFERSLEFYHKYSHPSQFTLATCMSFSGDGLYVGASFDDGKMDAYQKEIAGRVGLAGVFSNFIDGVKGNVAKW
ncbi:hypothetical protein [Methylocaldum gracile]|jgi:hypothetical protein|uniref:hypothetical protein n=1 Tax=unclassified Methylocaldum TaxID=2622260 RepID=UPI00105DCCEB